MGAAMFFLPKTDEALTERAEATIRWFLLLKIKCGQFDRKRFATEALQ